MSTGARVLLKKVKMRVPAGNATAAPPVGPTLGQAGVNLMDFCKLFNARTAKYKENIQLPVKLFTYSDRSFEFHVSTPVRAILPLLLRNSLVPVLAPVHPELCEYSRPISIVILPFPPQPSI